MTADPDRLVSADLSAAEYFLLEQGLSVWGDPFVATDAMARAMGFADAADFDEQRERLYSALQQREPLTQWDWCRALLATEIAFASEIAGVGLDWAPISGLGEDETVRLLRTTQRGLLGDGAIPGLRGRQELFAQHAAQS